MFSFFKKSDGYSLVETMSSIVILTIAIFPALGYFTNSINLVHQTEIRSQAMDMAVDTMEYFKMTSQNEALSLSTQVNKFSTNTSDIENEIINSYDKFTDDYDIDVIFDSGIGNNKKITATVYWDNDKKNYQLTSLVRDGG
ncbi:hypothetical protein HSACCH_01296 [Halanaerobium saccharolyticum subsp. saccharolyticum DSM 6643]|uniref:Prepilin-type N-terminal cleavage/methylation domain-containing protein n=1 Tax=Halanaerobium saccharolyticum subsp. saccharolyticum DSM 6643 TaxID=1293054 RepID=M5DZW5_9FIRM|nr:hypothetical protein [Halanaerobium saccharolyticum]CCU79389.1 hypothetical protein HSACCH_01296 [Halanaerobium saccharolyticum subsp. saccharolyticum DSM 6643]